MNATPTTDVRYLETNDELRAACELRRLRILELEDQLADREGDIGHLEHELEYTQEAAYVNGLEDARRTTRSPRIERLSWGVFWVGSGVIISLLALGEWLKWKY